MLNFDWANGISVETAKGIIIGLFVLMGVAGIFFLIDYNFLAAIQLTVYAGGIIVLMIFSVLLVHHIELELELAKTSKRIIVAITSLIGIGIFLTTIYSYDFKVIENYNTTTTEQIGEKLLNYGEGGFVLPFEVISVLLLAVMIGAIVIAKGEKLEDETNE